ncbi:putative alpha-glucosidase AglA [Phaeobacter piscinae]|uniref:Alpha-glucosidase AglA n=1 Tax=Phaeobacter piscinae TaxID=1580596 RepID=A0ABM6PAY5_9RHOB|nr:alpha-amylase family glycosyl hydrolase [Phaeobacter piscinae]ATG34872.1 putative alpha-glucosidase AglA [Phaeobacter piscinae]AUQ85392.1 putative alpha-glucosidase AglA [Phaeobacter piscinae]AUR23276.1 putative alpha-glucosidase AglA [Phaeobacter piscinae]
MNAQAQLDPAQVLAADPDWWRGAVIYQIYPRSYQDSNGDGIGDLRGITQRLPHIASLGVDAIWISPFFTSPMKDFGYDVSDYCDVDPMFGSLSDFDQLVAAAHRLGLRVMIDLVLSHTSDQHAWFGESRQSRDNARADWYVWADPQPDGTPPNNWLSIFGGSAWQWDPRREQYYLHNFLVSQPDLNFHCPAVQDALLDVTRFWLERGVDGFRLDTINFYYHDAELRSNPALPPEQRNATIAPSVNPYNHQEHLYSKNQPENLAFLGRFRALLDEYPAKAAVGEVGDAQRGLEIMGSYTAANTGVHMCYAFELLAKDVLTASRLAEVFAEVDRVAANGWACWAFSNHDVIRHSSRWGLNPAAQRLFTTMIMCLRGTACIYQGEELGLPEADIAFEDLQDPYGIEFWPEFKGRDGCRTPMVWEPSNSAGGFSEGKPWLPVSPEHLTLSVASQEADPDAMLHHYRRAIALRKAHPALAVGTHDQLRAEGNVAFFTRQDRDEVIFCAFNLGDTPAEITLPQGTWQTPDTDIALADLPPNGGRVALAPWQACLAVRV